MASAERVTLIVSGAEAAMTTIVKSVIATA